MVASIDTGPAGILLSGSGILLESLEVVECGWAVKLKIGFKVRVVGLLGNCWTSLDVAACLANFGTRSGWRKTLGGLTALFWMQGSSSSETDFGNSVQRLALSVLIEVFRFSTTFSCILIRLPNMITSSLLVLIFSLFLSFSFFSF